RRTAAAPARGREGTWAGSPSGRCRPKRAGRRANRTAALQKASTPKIPRRGTGRGPHKEDESCGAGICSCRPALRKVCQRAAEHGHHGAADLDSLGDVFRLAVGELDVDEALPPHLRALLADKRHLRRALDETVLDRIGTKR